MHTISIRKIGKRKSVFIILICNIFFLIIPVYLIVIGLWKINSCEGNVLLPPWMISIGLFLVIDRCIFWKRLVNETKFERTFPRPSLIGSVERINTWEENRVWSSSRSLLGLMACVRVVIFAGVLIGKLWSFDVIRTKQCDTILSHSAFVFCFLAIIIYLFCFVGIMYFYCSRWLQNAEKTLIASLNRLMRIAE